MNTKMDIYLKLYLYNVSRIYHSLGKEPIILEYPTPMN